MKKMILLLIIPLMFTLSACSNTVDRHTWSNKLSSDLSPYEVESQLGKPKSIITDKSEITENIVYMRNQAKKILDSVDLLGEDSSEFVDLMDLEDTYDQLLEIIKNKENVKVYVYPVDIDNESIEKNIYFVDGELIYYDQLLD